MMIKIINTSSKEELELKLSNLKDVKDIKYSLAYYPMDGTMVYSALVIFKNKKSSK